MDTCVDLQHIKIMHVFAIQNTSCQITKARNYLTIMAETNYGYVSPENLLNPQMILSNLTK